MQLRTKYLEPKLISQCIMGDPHAYSRLIAHYQQNLLTFLTRMCNDKNQAEDLFQETLIKVWRNFPKYDHRHKFSAWLFGIARNVAIDALRKKKVHSVINYTDEVPEYSDPHDVAGEVEAEELHNDLLDAINKLPEKQREIFLLRQHSHMSFREIAAATNQPLNTVLGHMHYAMTKLKKVLRDYDINEQ